MFISEMKSTMAAAALMFLLGAFSPAAWAHASEIAEVIRLDSDGSYLGIEMEEVTASNMGAYKLSAERGVIVRSVEKGSAAEIATLQAKDVILEYAGTPVFSTRQLARLVQETPPGREVDLVISRDGRKMNLKAKPSKRERELGSRRRGIEIWPRPESEREFEFEGPPGRMFRFRIPEGDRGWPFVFRGPNRTEVDVATGKPRLGVTLQGLTDQMGEFLGVPGKRGALVTSVSEGSPAAAAKLKAGDVIVRADDRAIEEPDDLVRAVRRKASGEKLELKVIREKKEINLSVELPKHDEKKTGGYKL